MADRMAAVVHPMTPELSGYSLSVPRAAAVANGDDCQVNTQKTPDSETMRYSWLVSQALAIERKGLEFHPLRST